MPHVHTEEDHRPARRRGQAAHRERDDRRAQEGAGGGAIQLLDIRDIRERQKLGWIPGSLHVPRGMLEFWLDPTSPYHNGRVDPEKRIIIYCAGGGRSVLATDVLREMGFPDVANFETGFNSWKAAGLPVEGAPPDAPKEAGPRWPQSG